jgi:aminodeoxyfutalosine deaminase
LRSVVFHELLGLPRDRADQAWQRAEEWLHGVRATEHCRPALSPHAPYSVRRDLLLRAAEWARASGLPLAIHLAESAAESSLLHHHEGPFVAFLQSLQVWDSGGLVSGPAEVLDRTRDLPAALLVHGNYLAPDTSLAAGQSIVYCPRTHAAFKHPPHPLLNRGVLGAGVRVALGTDSLASAPDLDMLAEARCVRARHPELPGDVLLRMLTLDGATALGFGEATASLTPGKLADLIVLPLRNVETADPHTLLWESPAVIEAVLVDGIVIHSASRQTAEGLCIAPVLGPAG